MTDTSNPNVISVRDLLTTDHYIIPIYQRNYAWGKNEIEQLIIDISDFCNENKKEKSYYLGTLVTNLNDNKYEVIDGQQRMTTLYILVNALKMMGGEDSKKLDSIRTDEPNLSFEVREKALETLKHLSEPDKEIENEHTGIREGYNIANTYLRDNNLNLNIDSFLDNVKLLRTTLPPVQTLIFISNE